MDTNRKEKTLLVSIYMHLIEKGNNETARVFLEESGLTSEDLGLHVGPDFLKNKWKITFDDSDFASATSMQNRVDGLKLLKMTNPNMAFVDNFIDLDPSTQNQILPTPQEDLANKKPNPLNLGTPGTLSSYKPAFSGDGAGSNLMSMNSAASTFDQQRALTMPNQNMAFDDDFFDFDSFWNDPSSAQNQILPTPQEDLANKHNTQVALARPNPLNFGTHGILSNFSDGAQNNLMSMNSFSSMQNRKMAFADNFNDFDPLRSNPSSQKQFFDKEAMLRNSDINSDPLLSYPSGARNQTPPVQTYLANNHNIEVNLGRPNPLNLGTPGTLSSYSDGARSSSMSMNSSASAAGMGETTSVIIESANNRPSLQEFMELSYPVTCCDFSSDGETLACISTDKTVWLWNTEKLMFQRTPIRLHHPKVIDVRFKPSSSQFAAYNGNNTVELWDWKQLRYPLSVLSLEKPLTSMDFNPRNVNQLCCADNNEVRLWNVNERTSEVLFKEYAREVRFQPEDRNMLAAMHLYNRIRLFDVEAQSTVQLLKGHGKLKSLTICWDISGKYIASMSANKALIWSTNSGDRPIYEIQATDKQFRSFTPHPKYPQAFVISSHQSLQVWNPSVSNTPQSVHAHNGWVNAICSSSQAGLIASTSAGDCLKLWK